MWTPKGYGDNQGWYKPSIVASSYVGLGDIASGALGYYSAARAYNSAFAASGAAIMDIVDSAGANPATINILPTGFIDLATLSAWIAAHGTASVTKLYDQTGNGNHLTNATLSQMPTINVSALNSLPGLVFTSGAGSRLQSANITQAQPISFATVGMKTGASTAAFIGSSTQPPGLIGSASPNVWTLSAGSTFNVSASDNNFHAGQALLNGASSSLIVDGVSGSGNAGAQGYSGGPISIGRANGVSLPGTVMEAALYAGDQSSLFSAINANQHGPNGYNF